MDHFKNHFIELYTLLFQLMNQQFRANSQTVFWFADLSIIYLEWER